MYVAFVADSFDVQIGENALPLVAVDIDAGYTQLFSKCSPMGFCVSGGKSFTRQECALAWWKCTSLYMVTHINSGLPFQYRYSSALQWHTV